jgi:hypothetical protein
MWRGRNNTVRLDGMAGQFVILIPDKDAVVVLTANARDTQDELNLVHNYLIPAIKSNKSLPVNQDLYNELQKRQSTLSLKTTASKTTKSEFETRISGKEFILDGNDYQIQSVYFTFSSDGCSFGLKRDNQIFVFKAGSGSWKITKSSSTSLLAPSRNPSSKSIDANYSSPQTSFIAAASYAWTDKSTLEITARFVEESLGAQTIAFRFSELNGIVRVTIEQSTAGAQTRGPAGAAPRIQLRGAMVEIK